MANKGDIAVLGVGNILLSDDGVGVLALEKFGEMYSVPKKVSLIDGGTGGLSLVSVFEGKSLVIMLDAVSADKEPGTLLRFKGSDLDLEEMQSVRIESLHDIGMSELLALAALGGESADVVLIGMEPESLQPGTELSEVVESKVLDMVEMAAAELKAAGVKIKRRS